MKSHGIFSEVYQEVGEIIVAEVNHPRIEELLKPDRVALRKLITKADLDTRRPNAQCGHSFLVAIVS